MEGAKTNGNNGGSGTQAVLNVLLVVVCCVVFGLFIYDYIKKNKELSEYKKNERIWMSKNIQSRRSKVAKLAGVYKAQVVANATEAAVASQEDGLTPEEEKKVQAEIANRVSENLSPIFLELDKDSNLTNKKLDKITNDLLALIEKETKKREQIRAQFEKALNSERAREDKLQRDLDATRAVYTELFGYACQLRQLYVDAHEDDSVLGNIGTAAMAPVKVVQNTLSLNLAFGRDKERAKKETLKMLDDIKKRYESIGNLGGKRRAGEPRVRKNRKKKKKKK